MYHFTSKTDSSKKLERSYSSKMLVEEFESNAALYLPIGVS